MNTRMSVLVIGALLMALASSSHGQVPAAQQSTIQRRDSLRGELAKARLTLTEDHPLVRSYVAQLSALGYVDTTSGRRRAITQLQSGPLTVRTVPLRHLTSQEAVKLLSPYSTTPGGGVFDVPNVRAVTIRETAAIWQEMNAVLDRYDRESQTVWLNFTLIRADNSGARDKSLAGLDTVLRDVLKFTGYHAIYFSYIRAAEGNIASQTLMADGRPVQLLATVERVTSEGGSQSVELHVTLSKKDTQTASTATRGSSATTQLRPIDMNLLSTGLTIPMGHTVVIGTAADGARALILAVTPHLDQPKRD